MYFSQGNIYVYLLRAPLLSATGTASNCLPSKKKQSFVYMNNVVVSKGKYPHMILDVNQHSYKLIKTIRSYSF